MSKNLLNRQQGKLFTPKFTRQNKPSSNYLASQYNDITLGNFSNTNIESTSSFRYGDKPYIVSSQQLKVDYSRFENHTFFHSAVANVNEAFDKIINFYPFEKSKKEIEQYEDSMTGFEKWVLDSFPKNVGYLNFSGTQVGESLSNGTQISVLDRQGASIQSISDNQQGKVVLDPGTSPFSLEFYVKIPVQANDNQVIFQKRKSLANNFTIALSSSNSSNNCEIHFGITSGSNYSIVSGSLSKGVFHHIHAMYDPNNDGRTKILIDNQIYSSSQANSFENLLYDGNDLTIGVGSNVRLNSELFTVRQTFSGSIDDFRLFHNVFDVTTITKRREKTFYNTDDNEDLRLYYRFNEPYGDYSGNNIVLDASGNSLHSRIVNFNINNRLTSSDVPVLSENINKNPVLFPTFGGITNLNTQLLLTASLYDDFNPNLITKLIPNHYFQDATNFTDFNTEFDRLDNNFSTFSSSIPGGKKSTIPSMQLLIKLLLGYAKFFDELKLLIDAVSSFRFTEYDDYDTTPDPLLKEKAKLLNIKLPEIFAQADVDQLLEGINVSNNKSMSVKSLNQVQNLIWRRILSEAPRNNLARGTIRSIKSVFRSVGIEPDNIVSIREYGGSKEKSLDASREIKKDVYRFLSFTGSYGKQTTTIDAQGYPINAEIPKIKTNFLSGSRIQIGTPQIAGTYVQKDLYSPHGISNNANDGLLTSGSFTYEGLYKWETGYKSEPESLIRMHITGTSSPSTGESCVANLVGTNSSLKLYLRDKPSTSSPVNSLYLTGVNVFDNDIWYVSFGKKNSHDLKTYGTASYFLRAAKQVNGEIIEQHFTSSIFEEAEDTVFKNISGYNTSGSFLVIGSQSFQGTGDSLFLNDNTVEANAQKTNFYGMLANARFFSKDTTRKEFLNRAKNYDSYGVSDPRINYNFSNATTGSYERLVIQTDSKQGTTGSDSNGRFRLFDFSKNNLHFEGTNFKSNTEVVKNVRVNFETLSDKFDVNYTRDKVRIRSFQESENIEQSYFTTIAPVSEVLPSEVSMDDNRLSIDMSVMKGLNDNILRMFNDFEALEDALGKPNMIFDDHYVDLRYMREIYFNNVLEKLDLQKYRELFKWIDNSFTDVVYSLIPRTTNFLGINFIYESHVLERNRYRYLYDEIYMRSGERDPSRGNIFLSQFVGKVKRH